MVVYQNSHLEIFKCEKLYAKIDSKNPIIQWMCVMLVCVISVFIKSTWVLLDQSNNHNTNINNPVNNQREALTPQLWRWTDFWNSFKRERWVLAYIFVRTMYTKFYFLISFYIFASLFCFRNSFCFLFFFFSYATHNLFDIIFVDRPFDRKRDSLREPFDIHYINKLRPVFNQVLICGKWSNCPKARI